MAYTVLEIKTLVQTTKRQKLAGWAIRLACLVFLLLFFVGISAPVLLLVSNLESFSERSRPFLAFLTIPWILGAGAFLLWLMMRFTLLERFLRWLYEHITKEKRNDA